MADKKKKETPQLTGIKLAFAEAYLDFFLDLVEAADACELKLSEAKKFYRDPEVRAYIRHWAHEMRMDREQFISRLEMIAFNDNIAELYEEQDIVDSYGKVTGKRQRLKRIADIPPHLRSMIKKLKCTRTKYGINFSLEMVSPEKALDLLAKIHLAQEEVIENMRKSGVLIVPGILSMDAWDKLAGPAQQKERTPGTQQ